VAGHGVAAIRQMDGSFDPARFGEQASDVFFKVQAAWSTRDMRGGRRSAHAGDDRHPAEGQ